MEAVELGEQVGGGVRHVAQRVGWMLPLPLLKALVGFGELEIIHLAVAGIDERGLRVSEHGGGAENENGERAGHVARG